MEKANHVRISELVSSMFPRSYLRTSNANLHTDHYIIEEFDRSRPLWKDEVWSSIQPEYKELYIDILKKCIVGLAKYEYFLRDVEVYMQSDSSLVISNFSKTYHSSHSIPHLKSAFQIR